MAYQHALYGASAEGSHPAIHKIGIRDLGQALSLGLKDFLAMPSATLFVGLFYPIIGLILSRLAFGYAMIPLIFPLLAGFALIGPLAAIGLYEMSRRRELGEDVSLRSGFLVLRSAHLGSIIALGAILAGVFFVWMMVAEGIYHAIFGFVPAVALNDFASTVLNTRAGWELIVVGNVVGLLFAAFVLTISVVSFPMILDRGVGVWTAIETSFRAVFTNPGVLALWGLLVAASLLIGALPVLIGLIIVMPVLGHATWHLYRRLVG